MNLIPDKTIRQAPGEEWRMYFFHGERCVLEVLDVCQGVIKGEFIKVDGQRYEVIDVETEYVSEVLTHTIHQVVPV